MIHDILPVNTYIGNNASTIFDFDFYVENQSQLNVFLYNSDNSRIKLIYDIDYSISEFKNMNGGYIVYPLNSSGHGILSENEKISLELTLPIAQETVYNNGSLLNFKSIEYSFDYVTRLIQILAKRLNNCVELNNYSSQSIADVIQNIYDVSSSVNSVYEDIKEFGFLPASYDTAGIVKIGSGIDVDSEGVISVEESADTSLQNLTVLGNSRLQYSPFSINSGTVLNGENNTLTYSGSTISCDPCTITTCDGRTKIFDTASSIDIANQASGSYLIFKDYETGELLLTNDFKISNLNPSADYWLDTSTTPANLKVLDNGTYTINNDLVYIGDCTILNGGVTALVNQYFNDGWNVESPHSVQEVVKAITSDFNRCVALDRTLNLVQQCDEDCYLYINSGYPGMSYITICDANGNDLLTYTLGMTVASGTGGATISPLLRKGTYFKVSANSGMAALIKIYKE